MATGDVRPGWKSESERKDVGLPTRPFLYTVDQVGQLMSVSDKYVHLEYAHYVGRSIGIPSPDRIVFRNIAPSGALPEWRCSERELIRFLRSKGYKYYERGFLH